MYTSSLMKQILSSDNLNRAYLQVVRNKGAEGVDGMKYTELKEHLVKNGEIIKEQLRTRKYKPQPVRRVEIPKPDGGVRNLGVPTVTDRFIQQAIAQVLTPIYEEQDVYKRQRLQFISTVPETSSKVTCDVFTSSSILSHLRE